MARPLKVGLDTLKGRLRYFAREMVSDMQGLAEKSQINYDHLISMSDEEPPGGASIRKLIAVGMNIHWLFTGEGEMLARGGADSERARVRRALLRQVKDLLEEGIGKIDEAEPYL